MMLMCLRSNTDFFFFFFHECWAGVAWGGVEAVREGRRSASKSQPCKSNQLYSFFFPEIKCW